MAENNTPNNNGRDNPRQSRIEKLQLRRLLRQERENRELRRQITTLLNAQRELEQRIENTSSDSDAINQEILKNNKAIDKLLKENQKYERSLQNAQDALDEEQSDFYRMALQDNNVELQRLKELNAELRSGNRITEERLEDLTEAMEELPEDFNENLRDVLRDLNLNSLTDQSKDTSEHITEAVNKFGFSQEQTNQLLGDLIKQSSDFNSKYKNILSDDDWVSAMDTFYDAGVKDLDRITELAESVALANNFGVDLSNAQNLLQYGTKDDVNNVLSGLLQAQQIQGITEDELSSITEGFESIMMQTKDMSQEDRKATIDKYMGAVTTLYANNMGDVAQALTENLQDIATGDIATLTDKYGGVIPSLIQTGDMSGLIDMYTGHIGMSKHEKPLLAQYGVSDEAMNQLIQSPITRDDFNASMSELMNQDDAQVISDRIENFKVGLFDRIKNTLAPASLKVSDTLGDLGIDWNDVENIYYLLQLAKPAWSLLTKFFGGGTGGALAGAGGAAASAAGAGGAAAGGGLLSTIGGKLTALGGTIWGGVQTAGSAIGGAIGGTAGAVALAVPAVLGYLGFKDAKSQQKAWEEKTPKEQEEYLKEKVKQYMQEEEVIKDQSKSQSQFNAYGMHRDGLDNVPIDGYKAILHSGEAVLTRDEAQVYRNNPGILKGDTSLASSPTMLEQAKASGAKTYAWKSNSLGHSKEDLEVFSKNTNALNRNDAFAQRTLSLLDKLKSKEVLGKAKETAQGVYDRIKSMNTSPTLDPGSPGSSNTGDGTPGNTNIGSLSGNTQASAFKNMTNNQFIDWLGGVAVEDYAQHKILPSLTIAQGIIESGWGKSGLTQKANALFGIKAGSSWSGRTYSAKTAEYGGKGKYYIKDAFRAYDNCEQSVADHGALLNGKRYSAVRSATNYKEATRAVKAAGYATDPNYTGTLNSMIEKRNLDAWDKKVLNQYEQGTPYVPTDQIALLHKGEMVVPKDQNPMNSGRVFTSTDDEMLAKVDKFMQLVQWGFEFIGKKQGEEKVVQQSTGARKLETLNDRYQSRKLGR